MVPPPWEKYESNFQGRGKQKPTNERRCGCMPSHIHLSSPSLSLLPVTKQSLRDLLAISAVYRNKQTRGGQGGIATTAQCSHCSPPGFRSGCIWLTSSIHPAENKHGRERLTQTCLIRIRSSTKVFLYSKGEVSWADIRYIKVERLRMFKKVYI